MGTADVAKGGYGACGVGILCDSSDLIGYYIAEIKGVVFEVIEGLVLYETWARVVN